MDEQTLQGLLDFPGPKFMAAIYSWKRLTLVEMWDALEPVVLGLPEYGDDFHHLAWWRARIYGHPNHVGYVGTDFVCPAGFILAAYEIRYNSGSSYPASRDSAAMTKDFWRLP